MTESDTDYSVSIPDLVLMVFVWKVWKFSWVSPISSRALKCFREEMSGLYSGKFFLEGVFGERR